MNLRLRVPRTAAGTEQETDALVNSCGKLRETAQTREVFKETTSKFNTLKGNINYAICAQELDGLGYT